MLFTVSYLIRFTTVPSSSGDNTQPNWQYKNTDGLVPLGGAHSAPSLTTVMGTGKESRSSVYDPPMFTPRDDTQEWRRRVDKWVNLIKSAHDNRNDQHLQTTFKILGQVLYNFALSGEQQRIVDEGQEAKKINFFRTDDPIQAAMDIVRTVADDQPMDNQGNETYSFVPVSLQLQTIQERIYI